MDRRIQARAGKLFRGRQLVWTGLVALAIGVMCGLGVWQLQRLAERRAANRVLASRLALPPVALTGQPVDPAALSLRRVVVRGTFDPSQEVVLRNRSLDGQPGGHVITPLRIAGSTSAVLVDRGWIPYTQAAPEARAPYAVTGTVTVEGLARPSQPPPGGLAPQDPPLSPSQPRLDAWFRVDIPRIQQQIPYPLLPIFVEQGAGPDPNRLPVSGYNVDLSEGPHLSYAIQWFSFAVILLAGYLSLALREPQLPEGGD